MKIAILSHVFLPKSIGGIEIVTFNLAKILVDMGHEIHIFTSLDTDLSKKSYDNGYYIHRIINPKIRVIGSLIFFLSMFFEIIKIRPNIIHVQGLGMVFPAYFCKLVFKIPYLICGHGELNVQLGFFTKKACRLFIKNADSIIALTNSMKGDFQKIFSRDVMIIPHGIKLNDYIPSFDNRNKSRNKILFVGRLIGIKGIEFLLQAMKMVIKELPNSNLIIVGDGELREYLFSYTKKLGLEERVEFIGQVSHDKIPDFMNKADILVISSIYEGFNITCLEAMACGLPVIATSVGALPDIIEEGINGFIVEPKKPIMLAERIIMLLNNESLIDKITKNNLMKITQYKIEDQIIKIEAEYQRISKNL